MIRVDISNIWGEVSLPDLLSLEKEIFDAHMGLAEHVGWQKLTAELTGEEILRIRSAAERIRADSDVFVVIGSGCGFRAVMELLQGENRNLHAGEGSPLVLFAGSSFSTRHFQQLLQLLEGKDFSIAIVGDTLESALAERSLRWMLERKYGSDEARYRIYALTDPEKPLWQLAQEEGWECFSVPSLLCGRFGTLTAAGLLPMAVAGIDIAGVLQGAAMARKEFDLRSFENPVWLYAAVRNLMHRRGKTMELLCSLEPCFGAFGSWWQQLFAGAEGTAGKGLFPVTMEFPRDLHSFGSLLRQGPRSFFETVIRFDPPALPHTILSDVRDAEGLNSLADRSLDFVEEQAYLRALEEHVDSGISVVSMECPAPDAETAGALLYFFALSCVLSACARGEDPFGESASLQEVSTGEIP